MAENWPWESPSRAAASTSSTQQQTSTSPLQSGSSQSSHETAAVGELQASRGETGSRPTLEETLRTCLTSTTAAPTTPPAAAGRSTSDSGPPAALRQSRSGGAVSGSGSKTGMKRRSRASRRVPTTVVEATSSDFRETVHRLTGIATPTPAPVRPQPQRAGPSTFIRPTPHVQVPPSSSSPSRPRPQLLNSLVNVTAGAPPPMHPAFWHHLQQRLGEPPFDPFIKSEEAREGIEPGIGASSSQFPLESTMSQSVSAPSGSIQTLWDAGAPAQSQSYFMNPTTTGPFDGSGLSGAQILQEDFDAWFQQEHPSSDYMR